MDLVLSFGSFFPVRGYKGDSIPCLKVYFTSHYDFVKGTVKKTQRAPLTCWPTYIANFSLFMAAAQVALKGGEIALICRSNML
jgi:hypothetical protein